ncbi:uncharacterized protein [Littorina saxatilis]|uniref:uncharacterized protein n=1 Tax=Littorina saxatilis TaxID=31220 RepID=UPI0038B50C3E
MEVGVFLAVTSCLLFLVASLVVCRRRAAARRIALDSTLKVSPPLCICNENVRLSYLEPTRQGSYVDAASCGVNGDVGFSANDVIADREQNGSRFGAGRMLGVDDLSRRPSSTPSINIYMDVLGEPAMYTNQDEEGCADINTNTETYEVPVTCEQPTEGGNERRFTQQFEHYIEMSHGAGADDDNGNADSDDVSLASAGYDDAWCSQPNFEPAATSDELKCSYCATNAANGHVSPSTTVPLPAITVSDEKGRQTECGYDTPGEACSADEEHVYDVIEDSDVED